MQSAKQERPNFGKETVNKWDGICSRKFEAVFSEYLAKIHVMKFLCNLQNKKVPISWKKPSVNEMEFAQENFEAVFSENQCCGFGMFIPDPDFYPSRIPDLGSRIQKQQQKREVKKN